MSGGEAHLIRRIAQVLAQAGTPADLSDDCAFLRAPTSLVTTDALVEGVHFDLRLDTPEQVGAQAAVANLSDLAASGGAAGWLVWSLALPPLWTEETLLKATRGFAETAAGNGARVVGGNLTRTRGPAILSVTAGGPLAGARPLPRAGGTAGDRLFVTGILGDAALGVAFPDAETRAARHRFRPHLREAAALVQFGQVTAAMDISDGLLLDAARLGEASGCSVHLSAAAIPVSALYRRRLGENKRLALTGGEDYVLLFASPTAPPPPAFEVGWLGEGRGLFLDGHPTPPTGYDHFGA